MAESSDLHASPDDRALPTAARRFGLLGRLFRRRKRAAPIDLAAEHDDADLIQTITGGPDEPASPDEMPGPPRREGFKHKLARLFHLIGLILWPPFLRGSAETVNRRLLLGAWTLVLLLLAGSGGWLVMTGQSLTALPGSEVIIGVARLALPPEAKLAPEQKTQRPAAPAEIGRLPSGLLIAPDPALSESTPRGLVPKIGADGRQPWSAYARPFQEPPNRPRIAIVLNGMGLNRQLTALAAERLPPAISFAFNPYASDLAAQVELTRKAGHEVLLGLPMEPFDYPSSDPGPHTLLTSLNGQENTRRLDWALARATGYIGFTNLMGGKYTSSPEHMRGVVNILKSRGLMFFDARTATHSVAARVMREAGGVYAFADRQIDALPTTELVDARLEELERIARLHGIAIGSASPYPATLERLLAWTATLESKGIALAPVSAMANRQNSE